MTAPNSNTPTDQVIDTVVRIVADDEDAEALTAAEVRRVVAAYISVITGEAVGTTKAHPDGSLARRVDDAAIGPCWRVIAADGSAHVDLRPTLDDPWTTVVLP